MDDQKTTRRWLADHDPLTIVRRPQTVDPGFTHPAHSRYVEEFWLPVLGPTPTFAFRRLALWLTAEARIEIDLTQFGAALGVNRTGAVNALQRLCFFRFARPEDGELGMVTVALPLPAHQRFQLTGRGLPTPTESTAA